MTFYRKFLILCTLLAINLFWVSAHATVEKDCVLQILEHFKSPANPNSEFKLLQFTLDASAKKLVQEGEIQKAIWYLESKGLNAQSNILKDHLESSLRSSAVVDVDKKLVEGNTRPLILTLEGNIKVIFKPDHHYISDASSILANADHEVLAYHYDQVLKLNRVPMTVKRNFGGIEGSLQAWIGNSRSFPRNASMKKDIEAFDYLINNRDRHLENALLTDLPGQDAYQLLPDHGLGFQPEQGGKGNHPPVGIDIISMKGLDEKFYHSLKTRLTEEVIHHISEGKLPNQVIQEIIERRKKLLKAHEINLARQKLHTGSTSLNP